MCRNSASVLSSRKFMYKINSKGLEMDTAQNQIVCNKMSTIKEYNVSKNCLPTSMNI